MGQSLFTFESARLTALEQAAAGVYIGTFSHRPPTDLALPAFSMGAIARELAEHGRTGTDVRIIILDAVTVLGDAQSRGAGDFRDAIANADRDHEWLLLPADPFSSAGGMELTAVLDDSCISRREKFALL